MGIFNTILEKLGLDKKKSEPTAAKPAVTTSAVATSAARQMSTAEKATMREAAKPTAPAPTPMSEVDVVKKLEQMNKDSGLNWKTSIVDLLKILDIDSSREARNELAKELGCPAELMSDSAKMNTWLHKTVLKKIAENGGKVPQELLD